MRFDIKNRIKSLSRRVSNGLFGLGLAFCSLNQVEAVEVAGMDLNFSFSQTYLQTSQNDFLIDGSDEGTWEWTEGVVNTLKSFGQLQVGAQLLVRDFGDEGNFRADLDWGYLDYAFNNEIGVRLGRMRLPFGFGNEYRDVDAARMEILFPQVFNPEDFRAGAVNYQGLGLYGTLRSDKLGSLQYHAFYGNNSLNEDFFMVRQAREAFNSPKTTMNTRGLGGLQLNWNTPYEGLRMAYTHLTYKGDFDIEFTHPFLGTVSDDRGLNLLIRWHLFSLEYTTGPWSFVAEYLNRNNNNTYGHTLSQVLGTTNYDDSNSVSYYSSIRRQWTPRLGSFISYGELYGNIADDHHPLDDILKEATLGFRFDLTDDLIFKSQLSKMRGYRGALQGTASDWVMFTSRITVVF